MNLPVRRTRENAVISGVCAGLARRWGVDPNLLRIALVVGALVSGLGLVLYGVGYVMLPSEDSAEPPVHRILPFTRNWSVPATAGALTVAGMVLIGALGGWSGFGLLPVIVALGIWYSVNRRRGTTAPTADPTPFERAAQAWQVRLVEQQVASGALPAPPVAPAVTGPYVAGQALVPASDLVRRPARNGRLWWLALALSAIGTGLVALSQAQGFGGGGALPYLAVVLASLGVTLLVATWRGRPPMIGLATVVVMISTLVTWLAPATGSLQEVRFADEAITISDPAELPRELSYTAGDVDLDLSSLALTTDTTLDLNLGAGDVTVRLPAGVNSQVSWDVVVGEATVLGEPGGEGINVSGSTSAVVDADAPTLTLRITMRAGTLKVEK